MIAAVIPFSLFTAYQFLSPGRLVSVLENKKAVTTEEFLLAINENLKDDELPITGVIINPLDYVVRQLYDYLLQAFGMINPDYLQLSENDVKRFKDLMDENGPLILGFDVYGENREDDEKTVLPINPDA